MKANVINSASEITISLEAARLGVKMTVSLWNLQAMCLSIYTV